MHEPDLEHRELCPDGCCVGAIGEDGRCGTCGLGRDGEADRQPEALHAQTDTPDGEPEVEARILCLDETCVGILGEHGRCGTCGRSGAPDGSL